ncbi:MAG: hypothetical protein JO125_04920 [Chloroflexi bacterium]|nr:hypothetical protein [Ktedonobacteraceae bacterium]MBV9021902.1 hypothetical protein [Ktedonobacteraceae bacterium]MBV9706730.1 hypothetical protein [Chloroflexota bacterium]
MTDRALERQSTPDKDMVTQQKMQPHYPQWPTSKPGPLATQPPAGQHPINALRSEQIVERRE